MYKNNIKNSIVTIVVTHNRLEILKKNINCLRGQTIHTDIIVFDNASTDGTFDWISKQEDIIYIYSKVGIGSAGGFNKGIDTAIEHGYDYFWIMDDDCLPKNNSLEKLFVAGKTIKDNYGWLSSKCLWVDDNLAYMNVQRVSLSKKIDFDEKKSLINAKYASFVSLFLKKDVVIRYGLPISDFFITADDWEYTRRISRKENCYVVNESEVVHAMRKNITNDISIDSEERLYRYAYSFRNEVYIFRREGIKGWIWMISKDIFNSLKCILRFKFNRLHIIWKGFINGVKFHPNIEFPKK